MLTAYDVVKNLVRTEKGSALENQRKYLFRVSQESTKVDIKRAIQEIYKVKVDAVNTVKMLGKLKRVRVKSGYTVSWKKAVVTLKEGEKIEVV